MACKKCGYTGLKEKKVYGSLLCPVCIAFAPTEIDDFQKYVLEKIDWKELETFRKYGQSMGKKQKEGMEKKAVRGEIMARAPFGYSVSNGNLMKNEDSGRVFSLFRTFLNKNYSLNSLAKNFGLSTNGLKKVLTNRVYLGETKFAGKIYKGKHEAIITPDLFYAVQRKLRERLDKNKSSKD